MTIHQRFRLIPPRTRHQHCQNQNARRLPFPHRSSRTPEPLPHRNPLAPVLRRCPNKSCSHLIYPDTLDIINTHTTVNTGMMRTTSASAVMHQRSSSEHPATSSSRTSVSSAGILTRTEPAQVATIFSSSPTHWNLQDEENLPNPFLKKAEKERHRAVTFSKRKLKTTAGALLKRPNEQNILQAYAAEPSGDRR